jgi:histidinol-phosphate aminotransferase
MSVKKLIRSHLVDLQTYDPVDPPELLAKRAGIAADQIVKLNGNENPREPSQRVKDAVASAPFNLYPDPLQRRVRDEIAAYTGLGPENIIAGAGADELIDLLFRLFISQGDNILDCDPTFAMYGFCARVAGGEVRLAQRDELFDIDVDAINAAIDQRTKIIFISSPNNPTGNLATTEQVERLLATGLIIVVDEAYFEFCGVTAASMIKDNENLVVLRTMSKWAGLAGLRVGYGMMSPELVKHMMDIKSPYNLSVTSEAALIASLQEAPALMDHVNIIVAERDRMFGLLSKIDGVTPWPSSGNFILCQFAPGRAGDIYDGLAGQGIFVRKFGSPRLRDHFRVSVGTSEQTDKVVAALKELV